MGKKLKIRRAVKKHSFKIKLTKKQKQLYVARLIFTKKVVTHAAYAAGAALILLSLIAPPAHSQTSEQFFPMTGIGSTTICATGLNSLLSYSGSSITTGNSAINCSNLVTDASGDIGMTGTINLLSGLAATSATPAIEVNASPVLTFSKSTSKYTWGDSVNSNEFTNTTTFDSTVNVSGKKLYPFGGMYQICDYNNCGLANPITGGYNCPAGYNSYQIGRIKWPDGTEQGSNMYACF